MEVYAQPTLPVWFAVESKLELERLSGELAGVNFQCSQDITTQRHTPITSILAVAAHATLKAGGLTFPLPFVS